MEWGRDIDTAASGLARPHRRRLLLAARVLAILFVVAGLAGLALHWFGFDSNPLLAAAAFAPYLMVGAPLGLAISLPSRQWVISAVAAVVTASALLSQTHLFFADVPPAHSVALTMMTSNLQLGEADPNVLTGLVRDHHVDVLTAEELTPDEVGRLHAAGLDTLLPYSRLAPSATEGDAAGTGIWSRYPLTPQPVPTGLFFHIVVVRVAVPGVALPPTVVGTHMTGPWPGQPTHWSSDMARLPAVLSDLSANAGNASILVGGDFNATNDTAQFRKLLSGGYEDATDQAGAGLTNTYPSTTWYPPLIAIDHILTRNAVAVSAITLTVEGSDHRALLASIALPAA